MPKYIVERDLTGAGKLTPDDLKGMAQRSNQIAKEMGNSVHWIESYVTDNRVTCIYIAPNDEAIQEHAKKGKFPCTNVTKVLNVIDRTTAE
jgi:hypothetical protein